MSPRLPPNYVIVPSSLVYSNLPASIQRTATRIYGLAWESHRKRDPDAPLRVVAELEELMEICELSRRQLFAHLRRLVNRGVLRYSYSKRAGIYVLDLPPRSQWPTLGEMSAENRTHPTIDDVDDSSICTNTNTHDQQQQPIHAVRGESEGGADACGKPHGAEILDAMGVAEPTRSGLLDLEHVTESYLSAWRAWFDGQEELGIGWVITQIRQGIEPPETREESERAERQRYLEWGG